MLASMMVSKLSSEIISFQIDLCYGSVPLLVLIKHKITMLASMMVSKLFSESLVFK